MTAPRNALVVGGTSGIGLATALRLAATGADVHVGGRDADRVAAVARTAAQLTTHRLDGGDGAAVGALAARLAPLDVLVVTIASNAGVGPFASLDPAEFRRGFDEKVVPVLTTVQAVLPHLAERGSISLVGAISAHAAMPGTAVIGAVNAAVESLVRPLSVELAPRRVNAVSPGVVDTPWWAALPEQARADYFAAAEKGLPVRHVSTADEIAEALCLVATNPSLTGTVLTVDGGARFAQL